MNHNSDYSYVGDWGWAETGSSTRKETPPVTRCSLTPPQCAPPPFPECTSWPWLWCRLLPTPPETRPCCWLLPLKALLRLGPEMDVVTNMHKGYM